MPTLKDAIYGLSVGDALGVPYEFRARGTFACDGMTAYGIHHQPAGTWSDDTSMALATCASIKALGRIDTADIRRRFEDWYETGAYTIDGLFDIGNTCARAITSGHGDAHPHHGGNGSLMRIAPLAFTSATDDQIADVSAITHANETCVACCIAYVHMLREIVAGAEKHEAAGSLASIAEWPSEDVRGTGYVADTLNASVWCLLNTHSYEECVTAAVDLGDDTDTTAAVAGALAGAYYGIDAIPSEWLETLRGKDLIEDCLFNAGETA